jgi:hypothetical protein
MMKTLSDLISDAKTQRDDTFVELHPYGILVNTQTQEVEPPNITDTREVRLQSLITDSELLQKSKGTIERIDDTDPRIEMWSEVIVPTYTADEDFRVTFLNPQFRNVYGLFERRIIGAEMGALFRAIGMSEGDVLRYHDGLASNGRVNHRMRLSTPERVSYVHLKSMHRSRGGYQGQLDPISEREYVAGSTGVFKRHQVIELAPDVSKGQSEDYAMFFIGRAITSAIHVDHPSVDLVHANIHTFRSGTGERKYQITEQRGLNKGPKKSSITVNGSRLGIGEAHTLINGETIVIGEPVAAAYQFFDPAGFFARYRNGSA